MNNFSCKNCCYDFFVSSYVFKIIENEQVYYYKVIQNKIKCPKCKSTNIKSIPKEGEFTTDIGRYSMKSVPERQKMLQKRSYKHFEKHIKDQRHEINRDPGLQKL